MSETEQSADATKSAENLSAKKIDFPIVGVGASAGGLGALKEFLRSVRKETPAAFILIQHLDPDHESHLADILKKVSPFPVVEVTERMDVRPCHVYVIQPNRELTMREGVLEVNEPTSARGRRSPIDVFFRSLAEDQVEMAVGVVLSGTGSDGTVGLSEIKAHGGMTLVQDPAEAEFPGMPASAVAHRCVDFVLPVAEIPRRIDVYFDHMFTHAAVEAPAVEEQEKLILRILSAIRSRQGHDFRHYKRNTIIRRIQRRMGLRQTDTLEAYLEVLREDHDEVRDLAQDLLISVTSFFRNTDLWSAIEEDVIPRILEQVTDGQTVRFWVPGCATGEEAYSYAMLLSDAVERLALNCRIQVYATDVDERAREFARRGIYPASVATDIGQERIRRFFSAHGDGHYQVSKQLREQVVFARHDLLSDPPFSRMDLVSCRNLLIYLSRTAQEKALRLLHFALNPRGILVLGSAESLGKQSNLFLPVMKDLRIFRRHGEVRPGHLEISSAPRLLPLGEHRRREGRVGEDFEALTRSLLVSHLSLGAVLVDEALQVLYLRGETHRYLEQPEGTPTNDLLTLAKDPLRPRLRKHCQRVAQDQLTHSFECALRDSRKRERVRVTVSPVALGPARKGTFIVFEQLPTKAAIERETVDAGANEVLLRELEEELLATREQLHGAVEDLESSNEELRASNEEIMSMNEELQTSNEELETSKEELQSLNEELTTLNSQLEEKVGDLEQSNNDLKNLLTSTSIAVLFLDEEFRVQRFTSASAQLFNLISTDVGRPLSDLSAKIDDDDLLSSAKQVLEDLQPREKQIEAEGGSCYLRRILPYRTQDNRIEGVVVVLSDVTELKRTADALTASEARFRIAIEGSPIIVFSQDRHLRYTWVNNLGPVDHDGEIIGKTDRDLFLTEDAELFERIKRQVMQTGEATRMELTVTINGSRRWWDVTIEPLKDDEGNASGLIGAALDITDRQEHFARLRESEERFRDLADNISQLAWMANPAGEIFWYNQRWFDFTGSSLEESGGWGWTAFHHPDQIDRVLEKWKAHFKSLEPWEDTFLLRRHDGAYRWFLSRALPIRNGSGAVVRWFGSHTDITQHIQQEEELRRTRDAAQAANRAKASFLANMSHDIRTPLTAILGYSEVIKNLLPQENQRLARLIKEASDQLLETLESVLNLSRLEGDGENMNITPMPLAEEVNKAYRMFVESKAKRRIEFSREEEGEKPVWCLADRSALHRVLGNLLSNAIKFSADNQRIWIDVAEEPGWAVLTVRDEGQGISPEFMPRAFDAFSQERGKLKASLGGSGLGLTITKQLVELMDGRIEIASDPGVGTTVKVRFPLAQKPETIESEPVKLERSHVPRLRILVCEDYEPTQTVVEHLLSDHDVTMVSTPEELMKDPGGHDVILLDVNLQGEDVGYLLMCKLRESGRHAGARIIAFTAHNLPGQRDEFVEMGFDDFLPKPFREEDLFRAVLPPRERGAQVEEENRA